MDRQRDFHSILRHWNIELQQTNLSGMYHCAGAVSIHIQATKTRTYSRAGEYSPRGTTSSKYRHLGIMIRFTGTFEP